MNLQQYQALEQQFLQQYNAAQHPLHKDLILIAFMSKFSGFWSNLYWRIRNFIRVLVIVSIFKIKQFLDSLKEEDQFENDIFFLFSFVLLPHWSSLIVKVIP